MYVCGYFIVKPREKYVLVQIVCACVLVYRCMYVFVCVCVYVCVYIY
jgi:hypothetical protein